MVEQYPDTIIIKWGGVPTQVNGKWTQPEQADFSGECRAEPNPNRATIKSDAGRDVDFEYRVYMPVTDLNFPYGAAVTITKHDGLVIKGKVQSASNGQLNSRVWV